MKYRHSIETRKKMSESHKGLPSNNKGKHWKLSEETKKNMSEARKGFKMSLGAKKKLSASRLGMKFSEQHIRALSLSHIGMPGPKNSNWRGGITKSNDLLRKRIGYRLWRTLVKIRDNFTCRICNIRGGYLVSHHLDGFDNFPGLRLVVDNGVTLCKKCHLEFHKLFGMGNNTKSQFKEYMKIWDKEKVESLLAQTP